VVEVLAQDKFILDATAGFRRIWFNKNQPNVLYLDKDNDEELKARYKKSMSFINRKGNRIWHRQNATVKGDFKKLDYPDNSFDLVVFDPPHTVSSNPKYWFELAWGALTPETWQNDLRKAAKELFRVLRPHGTLIFKWNNCEIPYREILELFPEQPLFGHVASRRRGKKGKATNTYYFCFMKLGSAFKDTLPAKEQSLLFNMSERIT
jgi:SAM-dependent methyltransferase